MKKILALILIFCFSILGQNTKKMIVMDDVGRSTLRMFTICEYKIVLKDPKDKEVKISLSLLGNGYFAGEHSDSTDFVITASHLFWCNSSVGDLVSKGILTELDKVHDEDLSVDNIVGLKDGKVGSVSGYTYDGGAILDIKILFDTPPPKFFGDPDKALLRVTVPKDFPHSHLSLMEDKVFDEIFYKENVIGKEVVARGFLLYAGSWFLRYRNALIEWIRSDIFQINELLDHGLSGGPVVYWNNEKIYAIGVVSHGPIQQNTRNFDMSWISIIKKSFLEKRNKK